MKGKYLYTQCALSVFIFLFPISARIWNLLHAKALSKKYITAALHTGLLVYGNISIGKILLPQYDINT